MADTQRRGCPCMRKMYNKWQGRNCSSLYLVGQLLRQVYLGLTASVLGNARWASFLVTDNWPRALRVLRYCCRSLFISFHVLVQWTVGAAGLFQHALLKHQQIWLLSTAVGKQPGTMSPLLNSCG